MSDSNQREDELFRAASNFPEAVQREIFLKEACKEDNVLHARLQERLASNEATMGSIEQLPSFSKLPPTVDHEESAQSGKIIAGKYKLLNSIGEGGMGTVWMAEQRAPVKRLVAIKLIKAGMDSKLVLARFEAERQALALMDHPNIARILDGGITESGSPYFVMEFVKGVPITEFCDAKRLTPQQRLELFVPVCHAIQHAHQKGIIHRDIKPSNVMVSLYDDKPVPKVIDFGVAKATGQALTEHTLNTGFSVVGTPQYMSPEQATFNQIDIDTRSDIYSLGVLLYELLAGSTPFEKQELQKAGYLEILRVIREDEPPRPSTKLSTAKGLPSISATRSTEPKRLTGMLRNELDWIVMKAMEKDRTRRYETANGFAADVLRYLSEEPVMAAPPSTMYRFQKFVKRNKVQVIAASLVFLALVAGITGTTLGLFEAQRQKAVAEKEWARAEGEQIRAAAEQQRAEQNFSTARALILDMGIQINQIETGQGDPKLADLARKRALDKAREQFDQFRSGLPDDASVHSQAASLHRYAANVSRLLNDFPAAEAAYAATIRILTDLAARHPDHPRYRDELAMTLTDRAMLEKRMGKLKVSAATLDEAGRLLDRVKEDLSASSARRTRAMIDLDRSTTAFALGQFQDTMRLAGQAGEGFDQLKAVPAGERLAIDPLLAAIAMSRLAVARRELKLHAESVVAHDDAVARVKALAGPNATRDVRYWGCESRRERARTAGAIPDQRAAAVDDLIDVIRGLEKLMDDNPSVAFYREAVAAAYLVRGELLTLLGRPAEATAELTKSLAVSRVLIDKFGALSASMLVRGQTFLALGRARAAAGKSDEAAGHWKNAETVFRLALKYDADNFHHRRGLSDAEQELAPPAK